MEIEKYCMNFKFFFYLKSCGLTVCMRSPALWTMEPSFFLDIEKYCFNYKLEGTAIDQYDDIAQLEIPFYRKMQH